MTNPDRLYLLAFDHRDNFRRGWFGIHGKPTSAQATEVADAKLMIFEGLQAFAGRSAVAAGSLGGLIDEECGAPSRIPERIKQAGLVLTMPVERSGADELDFEYGEDFGEHIERFDPDYAKVLVAYNAGGDVAVNERQRARLRQLSEWLRSRDRRLLLEMLVFPEPEQLKAVGGDVERFESELRPELIVRGVEEMQAAGVEPEIWKLEGMESGVDYRRVVAQCRSDGRDEVDCVVLGSGADVAKVEVWLREAAAVEGFKGFAIGRTIWGDPLSDLLGGDLPRDEAIDQVATRFGRFVDLYESALAARRA